MEKQKNSYEMCGRNPRTYLVDVSNERDNEHHTLVDYKALRSRDCCWRSGTFDEINLSAENDGTSLVFTHSASRRLLLLDPTSEGKRSMRFQQHDGVV